MPLCRTNPPPCREDLKSLVVSGTQGRTLPLRKPNTGTPIITGAAATMSETQGAKIRALATEKIILIAPQRSTFKSPSRSSSSTGKDHSKTSTRSSSGHSRDSARDSSSESTSDHSRRHREPRSNKPTERSSRKPEPRPKSSKRKSPDPEPKGPLEQEDELDYDEVLPDHVTRLLTGESELPETPAPKRRKSDSETPPPEGPTICVSAEVHAEAEMSDVSAEPPQADDVILKETMENPTSSVDQPSEDQAQEPSQGAEETVTPVPELSPAAQETVTPVVEPSAPTPEPTAAASESNESAAGRDNRSSPHPTCEMDKTLKGSTHRTGTIPKKVTTSQVKKQKSKDKKAPTAYEALLNQPPPRIPVELGYLDLDDLLIEDPRIGDTTDAELFVQKQMDLIISAKCDHKPSKILVQELSKTITLSEDAEGYAHVMANHLLAFIDAVDRLHLYTRNLYAVPKLMALFPVYMNSFETNRHCLYLRPTTNWPDIKSLASQGCCSIADLEPTRRSHLKKFMRYAMHLSADSRPTILTSP